MVFSLEVLGVLENRFSRIDCCLQGFRVQIALKEWLQHQGMLDPVCRALSTSSFCTECVSNLRV